MPSKPTIPLSRVPLEVQHDWFPAPGYPDFAKCACCGRLAGFRKGELIEVCPARDRRKGPRDRRKGG